MGGCPHRLDPDREQAPRIGWKPLITGYDLRGCRIACDPR
jgi:hypothetical protein